MGIFDDAIWVQLRKGLILSVRTCYRSAHKHPIIVGFVLFFYFLYRFLPSFVFGFLVSSSPVFVTTFALLGTLLSYGGNHQNIIPQVEVEEEEEDDEKSRETHLENEISSLKAAPTTAAAAAAVGFTEEGGDLVVMKNDDFSVETHVEKRDCVFTATQDVDDDDLITQSTSLINKELEDANEQKEYQLIEDESEFYDQEFVDSFIREVEPLMGEGAYRANEDENENENEDENENEVQCSTKEIEPLIRMEETDTSDLPPSNSNAHVVEDPFGSIQDSLFLGKNEDNDDELFDSDSDGAESSSPDASITDIMPMLDELHPLLGIDSSQPAHLTSTLKDDSDAASERSHSSDDDNVESGEELEHHEEEEDDDDDGEEEEEEGQHENHEDGAKAVVTWTEDDEKNLMDLGNSELERNRRLESLIARRWARKNFRVMEAEKNMIDLDFSGPPFQIAPISTTRHNPFDIHYDSNMAMGLPPIPGSAPSVMSRRNPFDLPYDRHEERPDLTGGSFNDEFMPAHEKDKYFSRHESFNLASFYFGEHKQEKQDKFRPYFVTEQMESGGVGYSRFQRQLSERSDSKVSTAASDAESQSSIMNHNEHKNLFEEQVSQEGEPTTHVGHTPDSGGVGYSRFQRQLSERSDSKVSTAASDAESQSSIVNHNAHKNLFEEQVSEEGELVTHVDHTPDYVILGSEYSKEVELDDIEQEDEKYVDLNRVEDEEYSHETHSRFINSEFIASHMDLNTSNVHVNPEMGEIKQHTRSSSSSSSDVHEKIFDVNIDEEVENLEPARGDILDFSNSMEPMVVDSELNESEGEAADDTLTEEPVYDMSPSASKREISGMMNIEEALYYSNEMVTTSTSSIASTMHVEVPDVSSTPIAVEETISSTHGECSLPIGSPRKEMSSTYERSWEPSPELCAIHENESTSTETTNISKHDNVEVGSYAVKQNSDDCVESVLPSVVEQDLFDGSSSSSESESEKEDSRGFEQVLLLGSDPEISDGVHQSHVDEKVDATDSSYSDGVSTSFASEEQPPLMEKIMVQPSSDVKCEESQPIWMPADFALHTPELQLAETDSEFPVVEARSLEDMDSIYKQIYGGEAEQPVVLKPVQNESILDATEVGPIPNLMEVERPIIQRQIKNESIVEETSTFGSAEHRGDPDTSVVNLEPLVHEEKTLEGIDSALHSDEDDKDPNGSVENKPQVADPQDSTQRLEPYESENGSAEVSAKSSESTEEITNQVEETVSQETGTEAKTPEDIDSALQSDEDEKHTHEFVEDEPQVVDSQDSTQRHIPYESENGAAEASAKALESTEEITNQVEESVSQETGTEAKTLEDIDSALHSDEDEKHTHGSVEDKPQVVDAQDSTQRLEPYESENWSAEVSAKALKSTEEITNQVEESVSQETGTDAKTLEDVDSALQSDEDEKLTHEPVEDKPQVVDPQDSTQRLEPYESENRSAEVSVKALESTDVITSQVEESISQETGTEAKTPEDIDSALQSDEDEKHTHGSVEDKPQVVDPQDSTQRLEPYESENRSAEVSAKALESTEEITNQVEESVSQETGTEAVTLEDIDSALHSHEDEKHTHESVKDMLQVVDSQDSTQRLEPYESENGSAEVSARALESTEEITSQVEESVSQGTGTEEKTLDSALHSDEDEKHTHESVEDKPQVVDAQDSTQRLKPYESENCSAEVSATTEEITTQVEESVSQETRTEAMTLEDIDSALHSDEDEKHTHESLKDEPQVVDPQDSTQRLEPYEYEIGSTEVSAKALESTDVITSQVEESVIQETGTEGKTLEDIDSALQSDEDEKHTHESVEDEPQVVDAQDSTQRHTLYESENGAAEISAKALESTEEITSQVKESVVQEARTDLGESSSSKAGSR